MANAPFTIRIFLPDGDPDGVQIIDRMNWTGQGIVIPRERWPTTKQRTELSRTGVYILSGYDEGADDEALPTLYIGEADVIRNRIEDHYQMKDFWDRAIVFTATNNSLNKAHVRWLEHMLIDRAKRAKRSKLDTKTEPQPPNLSEAERADTSAFLNEIIQILPLIGLRAFERPRPVAVSPSNDGKLKIYTIVFSAKQEGFERVFLGENCWYAIRISGGMLGKIKYIAAYQSHPQSAITYYAPVAAIEPYGEAGKYKLVFGAPAKPIGPIPFGDAPIGSMQGPRYTTLEKLRAAKKVTDILRH